MKPIATLQSLSDPQGRDCRGEKLHSSRHILPCVTQAPHWLVILAAVLCSTGTSAHEIIVRPSAEHVISNALAQATEGDIIRVTKGVYRENLVVSKRLSLVGEEGAVIDPSEPLQVLWQPAPEAGPGVWKAPLSRKPATLFLDGRIIAEISEKKTPESGPWSWPELLAHGPPLGGFKFVRALWFYEAKTQRALLHLGDNADPNKVKLSTIWTHNAAVEIRGAADARVTHLTIANGYLGVSLSGQSRRCTVSDCMIGPWDKAGVYLTAGATECLVQSNSIFRGAYEDWTPADTSKERYEIWQIHKRAGFSDRVGINLVRAGARNRVQGNHVFETFDGIDLGDSSVENLDKPLLHPEDGQGTEIADNLIERTRDSGMELGAGCIDVRVHHNILRQTHGGLRFKLPRIGPVFIYRNVLADGTPFNIWYSMDDSPAEGYVYHNTIIGGKVALAYSSFESGHQIGAPRWHYLNNLAVTERGFFESWKVKAPVNFTADHNVVVGDGKPWPNDPDKDRHSLYLGKSPLAPGFPPKPLPGSPAIDAGLDLSTYFHGKPLPGCERGYFQGKAPDAGAYEVE